MTRPLPCSMVLLALLAACTRSTPPAAVDAGKPLTYKELLRIDFNQRAQELELPLFWREDVNGDKTLSPDELAVLVGPWKPRTWQLAGGFSPDFDAALRAMAVPATVEGLAPEEAQRRALVREELQQGRPTLVETSLRGWSEEDRAVLGHLLQVGTLVERLYARQRGTLEQAARLPPGDTLSRALFHRNQGPWCEAPRTMNDPRCSALPGGAPPRVSGLYPADLQGDGGTAFCALLAREPNGRQLSEDHFSVVERADGGFRAVPYSVAWREDMEAVARELEAAAAAVASPEEAALKAYLTAAATAFRSNDWEPADRAWVAMGASPSRWYVRVAPDEVYFEPCGWKAGFALQVGRLDPASQAWKATLEPVKGELEKRLAGLAGAPYRAREVKFKLPDFVNVVANFGDQRNAHGGTVGQSLPNWGPVAEQGGRTTVMTNLYTDVDSKKQLKVQMASVFCDHTLLSATVATAPEVMSTVLHEAAHNLGPAHDYAVGGKRAPELFGGPLASMLEELKAQTSALHFADWLAQRKLVGPELALQTRARNVAWALNQISTGLYGGDGQPRPYPQLAAIQLGFLHQAGALSWKPGDKAGNHYDQGCLEVEDAKWEAAVKALLVQVAGAKARGDRALAERLKADFVDAPGGWQAARDLLAARWRESPRATFVYALTP